MTGPHPVVGVSSELADGGRRSADQSDVAIYPEDEKEILVAIIKRLDAGAKALAFRDGSGFKPFGIDPDQGIPLHLAHGRFITLEHRFGHILHPFEETHCKPGVGELFLPAHSPESVLEIVVLDARVPLDVTVAAMVVGEQKPFVRDEFASAPGTEQDDGILQRCLVDAVHVFGRKLETLGLHIGDTL